MENRYNFNLTHENIEKGEIYKLFDIYDNNEDMNIPIGVLIINGNKKDYTVYFKKDKTIVAKFEKEDSSIYTTFFNNNELHCAIESFLKSQNITIMLA